MIEFPTITICRNIFHDINTWLYLHGKSDTIIVSIHISSRWYVINYNTPPKYEEINIPVEDIKSISYKKNKEFQNNERKKLKL